MTDPSSTALLPPPSDQAARERVRVVLDGESVTVSRDYLLIRRRALIMELNALNESLGIRRAERDSSRIATEGM